MDHPLSTSHNPPHRFLVDGYNVLFQQEDLRLKAKNNLPLAREGLMDLLEGLVNSGHEVILVFDGDSPTENTHRGFTLVFCGEKRGETADKRIWKMAYGLGKGGAIVVSDDKKVQTGAGGRTGAFWGTQEFLSFARESAATP